MTEVALALRLTKTNTLIERAGFPTVLKHAIQRSLTKPRIKTAFKKSGIHPFNSFDFIDNSSFIYILDLETQMPESDNINTGTPTHVTENPASSSIMIHCETSYSDPDNLVTLASTNTEKATQTDTTVTNLLVALGIVDNELADISVAPQVKKGLKRKTSSHAKLLTGKKIGEL